MMSSVGVEGLSGCKKVRFYDVDDGGGILGWDESIDITAGRVNMKLAWCENLPSAGQNSSSSSDMTTTINNDDNKQQRQQIDNDSNDKHRRQQIDNDNDIEHAPADYDDKIDDDGDNDDDDDDDPSSCTVRTRRQAGERGWTTLPAQGARPPLGHRGVRGVWTRRRPLKFQDRERGETGREPATCRCTIPAGV